MPSLRRLLASLLLIAAGPCLAHDCPRDYRVGVSPIGYSYYLDAQGQPTGSSFDFYAELSRRSGCNFKLTAVPRARSWYLLEKQEVDLITPTIRTPERDHLGVFIEYFRGHSDLLIRRELAAQIHSLSDFIAQPTLQLGLVRGHSNGPALDGQIALLDGNRVQYAADPHNVFLRLQAGRIQGTIMPAGLYQKEVDDLALHDQLQLIRIAEADAFATGAYLSRLSMGPKELAHLQQHIQSMLDDGTLRELLTRRHGKPLTDRYYLDTPAP